MAVFSKTDIENKHLDWELFRFSPLVLYYQRSVLDKDIKWLSEHGYTIFRFDAGGWQTEDAFHHEVRTALRLSGYHSCNLDSLNDSLLDLKIPEEGGVVLVFEAFDQFASRCTYAAQSLLDFIVRHSRRFLLTGDRFFALIHSQTKDHELKPAGAYSAILNPYEWSLRLSGRL